MADIASIEPSGSDLHAVDGPDVLGPITAFRDWRVTADGLVSPRTGTPWPARLQRARCHPTTPEDFVRPPHFAPGHDCHCGVHVYFDPSHEASKVDQHGVSGIVSVWGAVEVHRAGMRAEFARVEALAIYHRWTRRQKLAVRAVAEELGVELVDLDRLATAALQYGRPLPPALVPPARRHWSREDKRSTARRRLVIAGA